MRRCFAVIMACVLILSSVSAVFAAVPADVTNTVYEEAVTNLVEKKIISGYEDGSFRPENTIDRAEACVVVVNALGVTASERNGAADSGFNDLSGYSWAVSYINYATEKGIVNGVGNNKFDPSGDVTYNEFAAMLINALGYKASDLNGSWPANYYNKAVELGIFKALPNTLTSVTAGEAAAIRGDIAIMTYQVVDELASNSASSSGADTKDEKEKDSNSDSDKDDETKEDTSSSGSSTSDRFADYNGRVYGMIQSVAKVKNEDGKTVDELEVLLGNQTFYLLTNGNVAIKDMEEYWRSLHGIRLTFGAVRSISDNFSELGAKNAEELTDGFSLVESRNGSRVTSATADFEIVKDGSIYVAQFDGSNLDGYKSASLSTIREGDYIRAYDVADDDGVADVVMIVKADDWDKFN